MSAVCPCLQMSWLLALPARQFLLYPQSMTWRQASAIIGGEAQAAEHCVTLAQPGLVMWPEYWPVIGQYLVTWHVAPSPHNTHVSSALCLGQAWACAAGSEFHFLPTLIRDRGAEKMAYFETLAKHTTNSSRFLRNRQKEIVCIFSNECSKMGSGQM